MSMFMSPSIAKQMYTSIFVNGDLCLQGTKTGNRERRTGTGTRTERETETPTVTGKGIETKTGMETSISTLCIRLLNGKGGIIPSRRGPAEG